MTTQSRTIPFKNLSLPVIAAPMFLVSGTSLLIECCKNGIVGTIPSLNNRTTEGLEQWIIEIKQVLASFESETGKTAAPFGVNIVIHGTNPRAQADLEICVKHQVPLIITSLGAVSDVVNAVHSYGGVVFHDVTNRRHAEKAAEAGVDGIIAVAAGAGGHAGTTNPLALITEIREVFKGTLILGGCINTGQDIATALQMGADYAYMGTRFINTAESEANSEYKSMVSECQSGDIIHTPAVSGIKASFMRPSLEKAGYNLDKLMNPSDINYGSKLKPMDDEAKAWKTVWSAGQGVAGIHDVVSVSELVTRLKQELSDAFAMQKAALDQYI